MKVLAIRPALYTLLVVVVIIGTFGYQLRVHGVFACSASGYKADSYLAYCNATGYGDYDHGALWFDLEPEVLRSAARADVLFLGTSRMQFAFSSPSTERWFAEQGASYYLLGFAYSENATFTEPLLSGISPRARAYVINVDRFFENEETVVATEIFHDANARSFYNRKRLWQLPHRVLCQAMPMLCGHNVAFFRTRSTGAWTFQGNDRLVPSGVADAPSMGAEKRDQQIASAKTFVSSLPVPRSCVLFTVAPSSVTPHDDDLAIADAAGVSFVEPRVEGLRTFDGSHLDTRSADRWSSRFYELAGPQLNACLKGSTSGPDAARSTKTSASSDSEGHVSG